MISQLDEAKLNRMRYLALTEGRSFSYVGWRLCSGRGRCTEV